MANNPYGWVSIADRRPKPAVLVLVHIPGEEPAVWFGFWDGAFWFTAEGMRTAPTHWAPAPEPPQVAA